MLPSLLEEGGNSNSVCSLFYRQHNYQTIQHELRIRQRRSCVDAARFDESNLDISDSMMISLCLSNMFPICKDSGRLR